MNHQLAHHQAAEDVVWAAYRATHLEAAEAAPAAKAGCARCGHVTEVMIPVGRVISRRFTSYDSWTHRAGRALCAACTWAYVTRPLRVAAHRITARPYSLTELDAQGLHDALSGPIDPTAAVVVPLVPGRKHLLPDAAWGRVTVDDLRLDFTDLDRARLAALTRLRAAGFTETALARPAPDHRTLTGLSPERWPAVLADWDVLTPWRAAPPWWQLGIRATR